MMNYYKRIYGLAIGIALLWGVILVPNVSISQVNIKIGYAGAYVLAPETNQLIDQYNVTNQSVLNEQMPTLHWMHGIDMGLRYSWNAFNFELL